MSDNRRKPVDAAHLRTTDAFTKDSTVLHAEVTSGPAPVVGRTMRLYLEDSEVLDMLLRLAVEPRWAAVVLAMAADGTVNAAGIMGTRYMGGGDRRQVLAASMARALRQADTDLAGSPLS